MHYAIFIGVNIEVLVGRWRSFQMSLLRFFIISLIFSGYTQNTLSSTKLSSPVNSLSFYKMLESDLSYLKPKQASFDEIALFDATLKYASHTIIDSNPIFFSPDTKDNKFARTFHKILYINKSTQTAKENNTLRKECFTIINLINNEKSLSLIQKNNLLQQNKDIQTILFKKIKNGARSEILTPFQQQTLKQIVSGKLACIRRDIQLTFQ